MYTQCRLKRFKEERVTWIPSKYAVEGKILKLKDNDNWTNGWEVIYVGATVDKCPNVVKQIKEHRNNTGDSLKKD